MNETEAYAMKDAEWLQHAIEADQDAQRAYYEQMNAKEPKQ